ncbi:hypothetical protein [Sphingomonas lenta]|uniref:hypothetical protein n=1 Tax=Sphingomonas lenta TaxID=1141887 RepID=UPI001140CC69|nr:hypothetical protein [Sphingomonas lenta]
MPDERVAYLGGGDHLFQRHIDERMVNNAAARSELERIGVRRWCANLRNARSAVVARYGPAYRAALISTMRQVVPDEVLASRMALGWNAGVITIYHNRIRDALDAAAGPLFAEAGSEAITAFSAAARSSPTVERGAADEPFEDWSFERPVAVLNACMLLSDPSVTREQFLTRKAIFDGFHQRKDAR